ncbi:MAG: ATP-binding cassette domain-containing protein [Gemmatimonadota bacterium]
MSPAVELKDFSKRFGWNRVLRGIDLRVERGTTLALVGPNGAGKTTLLKCLVTLLHPSGGGGTVCGHDIREETDEIRKRVGLVTVRGYIYDDLSAEENLRFSARMCGLDLSAEDIASLDARTEGWIAGLQLAALSMRGRDDAPAFVRAFAGDHRPVLLPLAGDSDRVFGLLIVLGHVAPPAARVYAPHAPFSDPCQALAGPASCVGWIAPPSVGRSRRAGSSWSSVHERTSPFV